jgi:hypothetical protein
MNFPDLAEGPPRAASHVKTSSRNSLDKPLFAANDPRERLWFPGGIFVQGDDWGLFHWAGLASLTIGVLVALWVYLRGRGGSVPDPAPAPDAASSEASAPAKSAAEQRFAPRRTGNPVAVQIREGDAKGPSYAGLVVDRSLGGLSLEVEREFPVGTALWIRASGAPSLTPSIQIQVKTARSEGRNQTLGCQFMETPPATALMYLG